MYAIAGAIGALFVALSVTGTAAAANKKQAPSCAGATVSAASAGSGSAVTTVLCLVNRERTRRGMAAVRLSQTLSQSASLHSEDMASRKYFSHVSPNGGTLRQRVARAGYARSSIVGETIAWGTDVYSTPAELVRSFMTSAGHKRILLDRRYREVGIGMAMAAPMTGMEGEAATLTLDFGRR